MKASLILSISFLLTLGIEFDYSIISDSINFRHYVLILIAIISALLPLIYTKNRLSFITTKPLIIISIYYAFIVFSLIWTKNSEETVTALVGVFVCIFFSFMASNYFEYNQMIRSLMMVIIFTCILSWGAFLIFGKYALNPEEFFRLKGIFNHSQRLSITLSLGLILLTINKNLIRSKWYKYLIIIAFTGTILLTKTRAFTTFAAVVILFHYIYSKKNYYLLFGLLFVTASVFYFDLTASLTSVYERNDQDITELTGRSALWVILIPLIQKKLVIGYGFGVFKEQSIAVFNWYPTHAHNLWLHQLYETGLIGMLLFQLFLYSAVTIAWKHNKIFGYSYLMYVLLYVFLCSFTGLVLGGLVTPIYFILILCTFCEAIRLKMFLKKPLIAKSKTTDYIYEQSKEIIAG